MHDWAVIDLYAQFHPRWFESPSRYAPGDEHMLVYREVMPGSWSVKRSGLWYVAEPGEDALPAQGWKLHIGVRPDRSVEALRRALPVLRDGASFKFLVDRRIAATACSKLWPRGSSGKLITVYPRDDAEFSRLGAALALELGNLAGPYILSDRRWPGSASVSYRYGGFRARTVLHPSGTRRFVIEAPHGELVPDDRNPYWSPPAWVSDPHPVTAAPASSKRAVNAGRFAVSSAIQFSNRGGVYEAVDSRTGDTVVLKESRPGIEVGRHRVDATALLRKEHRLLEQLAETGYFPAPAAFFMEQGHAFLAEEHVAGAHLGHYTIRRNPLYHGRVTRVKTARYFGELRTLWVEIAQAISAAHRRGIVLGDLSFTNVMVKDAAEIRIIDLECAVEEGLDPPVGLHTPGLTAPWALRNGRSDRAADWYGLGALMLGSVALAAGVAGMHPQAAARFLDELDADIALPEGLRELIADLTSGSPSCAATLDGVATAIAGLPTHVASRSGRTARLEEPAERRLHRDRRDELREHVTEVRAGIVDYLRGTADVARDDRLFPADLAVFETNPVSVAFGAAGVLYAFERIAGDVPDSWVQWLLRHARPGQELPPGLYLGQAGVAWVLDELGHRERALALIRDAGRHALIWRSPDVLYGAAGYGMACLKLWSTEAEPELLDAAVRAGEELRRSARHDERGAHWPDDDGTVYVGYAHGASGIALFLLYLHAVTGDAAWLRLGRSALEFDLRQGNRRGPAFDGFPGVAVDGTDGDVVVPRCYWDYGSAGVGTTLVRYLNVAPDRSLRGWLEPIVSSVTRKYAMFPQLFHGLAGMGNLLLDVWESTSDERYLSEAWQIAEGVLLFRMERPEGLGFPGEQAIRESADLATGAAGVGLFLDRLLKAERHTGGNFNFVIDELLPSWPARPPRSLQPSAA